MVPKSITLALVLFLGVGGGWAAVRPADSVDLVVLNKPLHSGRISPMLYSGFVELLDDVVPGMWAEMLGALISYLAPHYYTSDLAQIESDIQFQSSTAVVTALSVVAIEIK